VLSISLHIIVSWGSVTVNNSSTRAKSTYQLEKTQLSHTHTHTETHGHTDRQKRRRLISIFHEGLFLVFINAQGGGRERLGLGHGKFLVVLAVLL
jgi:hypothetical protein